MDPDDYLEITRERPNGAMIIDLLNRLFGTPRQTIDVPPHPYRPLFQLPDGEEPDLS